MVTLLKKIRKKPLCMATPLFSALITSVFKYFSKAKNLDKSFEKMPIFQKAVAT